MDKKKLIKIARGDLKADLLLKNAQIINVFTHTIEKGNIAIADGIIVGIGDYQAKDEVDLTGYFIAPGFIDGHVHIESSMLTPENYAKLTLPRGTTSVIADCHEIANVLGRKGIDFMLEASKNSLQDVFMMIPSCVPSSQYEDNGATLLAEDIQSYVGNTNVKGLGEMMDYIGVVNAEEEVLKKIELFSEKTIDGHAPGLTGKALNAYCLAGVETDHECVSPKELIEKVKAGMYVHLREGSQTKNVIDLLPGVSSAMYSRILLCSDDLHPSDILKIGHIDHNINLAIEQGLDPCVAISMATINIANCYHLKNIGAIAPGYQADLLCFKDLDHIRVDKVYKKGTLLAEDYQPLFSVEPLKHKDVLNTVHLDTSSLDLTLDLKHDKVNVIGLVKNNILTNQLIENVHLTDGLFECKNNPDLLKLAVVERHHQTGRFGLGLVKGYGLKNGAIAMTIAHDSHNIICLGDSDEDMMKAIMSMKDIGGGITLVSQGKIIESLPLEVAGLMSLEDATYVSQQLDKLEEKVMDMGVSKDIEDPFLQLAFLSLAVIPHLKVTNRGLFDVDACQVISLEVGENR